MKVLIKLQVHFIPAILILGLSSCGIFDSDDNGLEIVVENLEDGQVIVEAFSPAIVVMDNGMDVTDEADITLTLNGEAYDGEPVWLQGDYELHIVVIYNEESAEKTLFFSIDQGVDEVVTTISELKELTPEGQMQVSVSGYHEPGDGGGGVFLFDAGNTDDADGGMIIASDVTDTGRWVRDIPENIINIKYYGAQSELEEDQGERIVNAALFFFDRELAGTVYIPEGTFYIARELALWEGVSIKGDGMDVSVLKNIGTGYTRNSLIPRSFHYSSERTLGIEITDLTIDVNMYELGSWIGFIWIEPLFRDLTIERIHVTNSGGNIIRLMKESRIAGSIFDNMDGRGLSTGWDSQLHRRFRDNEIVNNVFHRSVESPTGPGLNLSRAENNIIRNNKVVNEHPPGDSYGGIRIPNGSDDNLVEGNYVKNFPRGIWVMSGSRGNEVRENEVVDSWITAMFINSSHERNIPTSGNSFIDNVIRQENPAISNTTDLIRIHEDFDETIVDNVIIGNEVIITEEYYQAFTERAESEYIGNSTLEEGLVWLTNGAHLEGRNEVADNFVSFLED